MTLDDFLNHIEAGGALNTPEIYRLMDEIDRKSTRLNSSHPPESRMPSSA